MTCPRLRGMLSLLDGTLPARRALADVFLATHKEPVPWLLFYQQFNRLIMAGRSAVCGGIDGETLRLLCGGPATVSWQAWSRLPYAREYAETMAVATARIRGAKAGPDGVVRLDPGELAGAGVVPRIPGMLRAADRERSGHRRGQHDRRRIRPWHYARGPAGLVGRCAGAPEWQPYRYGPNGELMAESASTFASNLNLRAPGT